MFTAFFLAFGVGALIALIWFFPTLLFGIGKALYRAAVDLPSAAIAGIRQGVARGNRMADRLQGKVSEPTPDDSTPR